MNIGFKDSQRTITCKAGVTTVRKLMDVKESAVYALYKNDEASEEFINHCLTLTRLYTAHKKLESMGIDEDELQVRAASLASFDDTNEQLWATPCNPKKQTPYLISIRTRDA